MPFFGIPACTASGLARVALHTGAAVVPAFTIWDSVLRKYRVEFDPALELVRTGDHEADTVANTALFTKVHRRVCAPLSRPVAVGASPLEDAAGRRAGVVLARNRSVISQDWLLLGLFTTPIGKKLNGWLFGSVVSSPATANLASLPAPL